MKHAFSRSLAGVLLVALTGCACFKGPVTPPVSAPSVVVANDCDRDVIAGQFIFTFRIPAVADRAQKLFTTSFFGSVPGVDSADDSQLVPLSPYSFLVKSTEDVVSQFRTLLRVNIPSGDVEEERNAKVRVFAVPPNDPDYPSEQCALVVMNAEAAWKELEAQGPDASKVYVSVVDSGVNDGHPDLKDAVKVKADDVMWHGTHLAGLIGARDDQIGMAGVAWKVNLRSYQFLDEFGMGTVDEAIKAVSMAVKESPAPDIVLLAWGTGCNSAGLKKLITENPTVLFVAAAGNNGRDLDKAGQAVYPAAYDNANLLTVMATTCDDKVARFSATGDKSVDIAVPGEGYSHTPGIRSTVLNNRYGIAVGTSMAAAYAAGGAALVKALHPGWKAAELKKCLMSAVDPLIDKTGNVLKEKCVSEGHLNLAKAATCP